MILRKLGPCGVGLHEAALRLDARSASADSLQYSEKSMGLSSLSDWHRGPRFVRVAATLRPACCGLDADVLCARGLAKLGCMLEARRVFNSCSLHLFLRGVMNLSLL